MKRKHPGLANNAESEGNPGKEQLTINTDTDTDTAIRHVTKPGANLFFELGFSPAEAKSLQAASQKQIDDTLVEMLSRIGKPVKLVIG